MAHVLIVGMTESGKTTLAKKLAHGYRRAGIETIVLDPLSDPGWNASFQTRNKNHFLRMVKRSRSCAVFVDESGQMIGRYADEMSWLATSARHWGHKSHFLSQRAMQIDKTVRDQCSRLFVFRVSKKDAETLAEEYAQEELRDAHKLERFEFIATGRFREPKKMTLDKLERLS